LRERHSLSNSGWAREVGSPRTSSLLTTTTTTTTTINSLVCFSFSVSFFFELIRIEWELFVCFFLWCSFSSLLADVSTEFFLFFCGLEAHSCCSLYGWLCIPECGRRICERKTICGVVPTKKKKKQTHGSSSYFHSFLLFLLFLSRKVR